MARTESKMLALGTRAPDFHLTNTESQIISLESFSENAALLAMFICNHCPYVKHLRQPLAHLTAAFMKKGVGVVAINSNDAINYPDDSFEMMAVEKRQQGYEFHYLFDETQEVAKAYQAACTPDFYLFDDARRLVYRGQFDGSRPSNTVPPTGSDLRAAIEALLVGRPVNADQKPSLGCNIKWK